MRLHSSTVALRVFLLGAMGTLGCAESASIENKESGTTEDGTAEVDRGQPDQAQQFGGCTDPQPLMQLDTGIFECKEGYLHRAEARRCPSELPRDRVVQLPEMAADAGAPDAGRVDLECSSDIDCNDPLSRCELIQTNAPGVCFVPWPDGHVDAPQFASRCIRGCREDSDCGDGSVCVCGSPIGQCTPVSTIAGCHSDADCGGTALCLENSRKDILTSFAFACELPGDTCRTSADCSGLAFCRMTESGRRCQGGPACGRPFIVGAEARLAPVCATPGWLRAETVETREGSCGVRPVPAELARQLARRWTEIGLMEHASIAAFARFTLQLLALGAPLELIEESNRAQADEARHARLAFELATHYAGTPVGPGRLSLSGPMLDADGEAILQTTIEEGCIGETCAALEAAFAADLCSDPVVAQTLRAIAEDEARHAALAWRTVQWMTAARPSLKALARRAFAEAAEGMSSAALVVDLTPQNAAEQYGALQPSTLAACRQRSIRDVVLPCAKQLLGAETTGRARDVACPS